MAKRLEGKISLITGGGIGRAAALLFAQEGSSVIVVDLKEAEGQQTVALIKQQGGKAIFTRADVSKNDDCQAMVACAMENFGRLNIAFNNAGITGQIGQLPDLEELQWDLAIAVNLKSIFLSMKYEITAMRASGGGTTVNTASVAGLVGSPGSSLYCASKHGVIGITRAAALDHIAEGIRINAICPGATDTTMLKEVLKIEGVREHIIDTNPISRLADPIEIARAALFLVSDESSYMVGAVMPVDGGFGCQ